jgi:hypothetical protein
VPHQMCRECHRLVSDGAIACPHCGITQPTATDGPWSHLRPFGSALLLGFALVGIGGLWFRYQMEQLVDAPPARAPVAGPEDPHPGFRSLAQGVWLGAALFGRENQLYVGRITSLDCPRQAVGPSPVACLQIEFADGRREWVERTVAEGQYLAARRD